MKFLYSFFGLLGLLLLFRLLSSDGGLGEYFALKKQLSQLEAENLQLSNQNHLLQQEVKDLQSNTNAIETIARQKLGMIKDNEVFVQVIELPKRPPKQDKPALETVSDDSTDTSNHIDTSDTEAFDANDSLTADSSTGH